MKRNAAGLALVDSTHLDSSGFDSVYNIARDGYGKTYVTGENRSTNFPVADVYHGTSWDGDNAFVTKFATRFTNYVVTGSAGLSVNRRVCGSLECSQSRQPIRLRLQAALRTASRNRDDRASRDLGP
jgi:hypothetical protein